MQIAFFSNYLSPHQIPFSDAMYELLGNNYKFISCEPYSEERKKMGWSSDNIKEYEIKSYESSIMYEQAKKIALSCDAMIIGSAKWEFVKLRVDSGKILFRYSERLLKQGLLQSIKSLDLFRFIKMNITTRTRNLYFLSASMYAPFDYKLTCGKFKKRYKWGYYPETVKYDLQKLLDLKENNNKIKILWAGRLIPLKHPELTISLIEKLIKITNNIELNIIGNGVLEKNIADMIREKNLTEYVHMLGAMSPENVRRYMDEANIYIFTSDYNEGWGAVLNEAMNSACAVVCCSAIGSSGYLIENGINGYTYDFEDANKLFECTVKLIKNSELRKKIGVNAYKTITELWSSKIAAERFIKLSESLLGEGRAIEYKRGPLSEAEIIKPRKIW